MWNYQFDVCFLIIGTVTLEGLAGFSTLEEVGTGLLETITMRKKNKKHLPNRKNNPHKKVPSYNSLGKLSHQLNRDKNKNKTEQNSDPSTGIKPPILATRLKRLIHCTRTRIEAIRMRAFQMPLKFRP